MFHIDQETEFKTEKNIKKVKSAMNNLEAAK